MRFTFRFSTRKLLVWFSLYALLLGVMAALPVTELQMLASAAVLTLFVMIDSMSGKDRSAIPARARYAIAIAHYATAFALAVAACYVLFMVVPEPVPPQPILPAFAAALYVVSGQMFADITNAIDRAMTFVITCYEIFAFFSVVAFVASLFALRQFRSAKWYLVFGIPGTCLGIFLVVVPILYE